MSAAGCDVCRSISSSHPIRSPSWVTTVVDLLWLLLIGFFELLRQRIQRAPLSHTYTTANKVAPPGVTSTRLFVITGATSGIGAHLAAQLHAAGARLIVLTLPHERVHLPGVERIAVDFASRASTRRAADDLRALLPTDPAYEVVFWHCAGVYHPRVSRKGGTTASVVRHTFAVNTVMPALFVSLISDLVTSVVCIGSSSQRISMPPSLLQCPFRTAATPYAAYPLSKLLFLAFIERWSCDTQKPAIVIHPGVVATNLYAHERGLLGKAVRLLVHYCAMTPVASARRVLAVLDRARFFDIRTVPLTKHCQMSPSNIYWDAATVAPVSIPYQIAYNRLRDEIYHHVIQSTAETWANSEE